jgi:hypothetical protein
VQRYVIMAACGSPLRGTCHQSIAVPERGRSASMVRAEIASR